MFCENADLGNAHNSFRYRYCNTDTVYTYTRNHANEINYLREMMPFLREMMPFSQRASVPSNHNHVSSIRNVNEALSGRATLTVVQLSLAAAERSTRAGECALRPRAQLAAERMSLLRAERSLRSSRSVNQLTLSICHCGN